MAVSTNNNSRRAFFNQVAQDQSVVGRTAKGLLDSFEGMETAVNYADIPFQAEFLPKHREPNGDYTMIMNVIERPAVIKPDTTIQLFFIHVILSRPQNLMQLKIQHEVGLRLSQLQRGLPVNFQSTPYEQSMSLSNADSASQFMTRAVKEVLIDKGRTPFTKPILLSLSVGP